MASTFIAGTFVNCRGAASEPFVASARVVQMRLTAIGLDALNTLRTERRTSPSGPFVTQVTYNSNQNATAITVAPGEEWRVVVVDQQSGREIRYVLEEGALSYTAPAPPPLPGGGVDPGNGLIQLSSDEIRALSASVQPSLAVLDYVEGGLLPPVSGALAQTYPAGTAWINNRRILMPATPVTFTATSDNYIDLRDDRTLIITPVGVGAAAPAIPANSLRLGFCTTNASAVTGRTISAFDSLGNWMHNVTPLASCKVARVSASGYGGAALALPFPDADIFDNAAMHDPVTNNTRITFPSSGVYSVDCSIIWFAAVTPASSYTLNARLDGSITDNSFPEAFQGTQATQAMRCSGTIVARAGQYLEMVFNPNGASGAIDVTRLNVHKLG